MHGALNVFFEGDQPSKETAMHALVIVQQLLRTRCPHIHAARLAVILAAVAAAVRGRRLTLTELGRSLPGGQVKHNIKRIDRLLGNRHLAVERIKSVKRVRSEWHLLKGKRLM